MHKRHDFARLEREFITTDISLRGLCRKYGISAHSLVTVQAKRGRWQEKREQYQAKADEAFTEQNATRMANRRAELQDKAIDVIDEALDKFRDDMRATKLASQPDSSVSEEPVMRLKPRDVAILLDRLMVLFERPSHINEDRDLSVGSELPLDALNRILEVTQGRAVPPTSPLPRTRRVGD